MQGIQRLPLYLKHTKTLYCLFDAAYASRLWCIWELAIYLKLREKPKVEFISISANSMAVGAVVFSTITSAVSYVTYVYIAESAELTDNCVKWHLVAIAALLKTFIFIFGQQHFINVISLRHMIENYDARNAKLTNPDDAPVLLQFVDELFSADIEAEDAENELAAGLSTHQGIAASSSSSVAVASAPGRESQSGEDLQGRGIDLFNQVVRRRVNLSLPSKGIKSWVFFGYVAGCLFFKNDSGGMKKSEISIKMHPKLHDLL